MSHSIAAAEQPESPENPKRAQADIKFPYLDLEGAISVAQALQQRGGGEGDYNSLAAWMDHKDSRSGRFRTKVYAARTFGLVEINKDEVRLTQLGRNVVNPVLEAGARADAFLHVPLYREVYEAYKTGMLPPEVGLERKMATLGVPSKQAARARQVLTRSADQAGFFEFGKDRLVKPVVAGSSADPALPEEEEEESSPVAVQADSGSSKSVDLTRSGAIITISVSKDTLQLEKDDRDFVMRLIDQMEEFCRDSEPRRLPPPSD